MNTAKCVVVPFTRVLAMMAMLAAACSNATLAGAELPVVTSDDWAAIRSAYDAARHAASAVDGGHAARNPEQKWVTFFDGAGFTITPDAGGWTWGLQLDEYGWGANASDAAAPRAVAANGQRVAYAWDDDITEWYVNDQRGLEHGFTVDARPTAARGSLCIAFQIRGGLIPAVSADGRDVTFVDQHGGAVLTYAGLSVSDADGRDIASTWLASVGELRLAIADGGARYPLTIDPVAQQAYLKASNTGANDHFGASVAVSGDTVVIGAWNESSNASGINGDQSNNGNSGAGAAYVFVRNGATWSQQAYLKASNNFGTMWFGQSVAISGDTIVVGSQHESSFATGVNGNQTNYISAGADSGAAYVFVRNGTTWTQQAYLKASNAGVAQHFGLPVAVDGDTIVVGSYAEDSNATGVDGNQADFSAGDSGAAYVFARSGTTWTQQAYLKATNTESGDWYGLAVAVSGDTVAVASYQEDSDDGSFNNNMMNSGAVYVYARAGTTWNFQTVLKGGSPTLFTGGDLFGYSIALSGDTLVVGAHLEDSASTGVSGSKSDNSALGAGAAYVFVRAGTTWSEQAYLKASNTGTGGDQFGASVSVHGDMIAVGAPTEDSNATGVNGSQTDNSVSSSGAAYVFVKNGGVWTQHAYLKASNTGAADEFGTAVCVSGGTVIVGTEFEDSNAVGVNGNGASNSAANAGAAYVFDLDLGPWTDLGFALPGIHGDPSLVGVGPLTTGSAGSLTLSNAAGPGALAILFVSTSSAPTPLVGGTLVAFPVGLVVSLNTIGNPGTLPLAWPSWPAGASGLSLYFQYAIQDAAAMEGAALSNALRADVP